MNLYKAYLNEIKKRKEQGLKPKPIDNGLLIKELVLQIIDVKNKYREDSLKFLIYNTLPGTTNAAKEKSNFLKEIILGNITVKEISTSFALELLSHMKGGPSISVLLDIALGKKIEIARNAANILKTQVFLYEADTKRLKDAYEKGNALAKDII